MMVRTAGIAEREIVQAAMSLDQQQWGTGAEFLAAVDDLATSIDAAPLSCPTVDLTGPPLRSVVRWRHVGRFPYLALFTVENEGVVVVAVVHNRRDVETILRQRIGLK